MPSEDLKENKETKRIEREQTMNNTVSSADLEELHTLLRLFLSDSMNKVNIIPQFFVLSGSLVIWILLSHYL